VTSLTGSVIKDIINVISRRNKNVSLKILPVQVQGAPASSQIAGAINKFNELKCVDVIILARGGGSLEELWAFNEEIVARSIYDSSIPVISAVGHETDFTISDFVADLRAPTPSAAAEIVVPEKIALEEKLISLNSRLKRALLRNLDVAKMNYDRLRENIYRQPFNRVYQEQLKVDSISKYIYKWAVTNKDRSKSQLSILAGKLNSLSPLAVLSRGYAIVQHAEEGRIVKSVEEVEEGDRLQLSISDGKINCVVTQTQKEDNCEE
jgi:exodeoxyribonuclease VII large subunit